MNIPKRCILALAAVLALNALPVFAQTAWSGPLPPALEAAITESHEALGKILNGDPSGYTALFADSDDITLGNPFGPFGKGRAAVVAALNNAANKYTDGSVVRIERVAVYGGGDQFVLVEIEHDQAKLGTATESSQFSARVTSVYGRNGARWNLIHRHADPITTARPAESMLSVATSAIHSNADSDANKALVQTFLKALETGDVAARNAVIEPGGKMHGLTGNSLFGAAVANIAEICPMCAAMPDRKISINMMVAEGNLVAVRTTWTGTYLSNYRGMGIANPIPVTVRYVNIYRIANGRIIENWASIDRQSLAEQLGYTLVKPASLSASAAWRPPGGLVRRDQVQLEEMP